MNLSLNYTFRATSNASTVAQSSGEQWGFMVVFRVVFGLIAFSINSFILYVFITQRQLLSTPFNLYLVNLLSCNVLYSVFQNPPEIINTIYQKSGWWLGEGYCTLFLYSSWAFGGAMKSGHSMISLNRLWAVLFPNGYRLYHSRKTALLVLLLNWLAIHAVFLPGIIMDARYFRLPVGKNPCRTNVTAQKAWTNAATFLFIDCQMLIVVLTYPVIYWKRQARERLKVGVLAAVPGDTTGTSRPTGHSGTNSLGNIMNFPPENRIRPVRPKANERPGSNRAFRVLTAMTVSVIFCWTPVIVNYRLNVMAPSLAMPAWMGSFSFIIMSLQSALDPLLFVVVLKDLRDAVGKGLFRGNEQQRRERLTAFDMTSPH